mgnify:CR=1 FL=1
MSLLGILVVANHMPLAFLDYNGKTNEPHTMTIFPSITSFMPTIMQYICNVGLSWLFQHNNFKSNDV